MRRKIESTEVKAAFERGEELSGTYSFSVGINAYKTFGWDSHREGNELLLCSYHKNKRTIVDRKPTLQTN